MGNVLPTRSSLQARLTRASDPTLADRPATWLDSEMSNKKLNLAPAKAAPVALVATGPVLAPKEFFGFAPYWNLTAASQYDVTKWTTLAYFGIDINSDGT